MALRFNTFRSGRYLRSKFVEGKYLLASEATDIELEMLDLLRKVVNSTIGDVAVDDAWQVERLSDTQILIKPGQAYFKGLPFAMRNGKDQLVSGAVLSIGTVPVGTVVTDDSSGAGKIVTFNSGSTTPTNVYRIVITAREELITEVDDPFLQNVNLTESTAQKIRLLFQLNIVPESLQTESPVPYRDETSASGGVTNFPAAGGMAAPNFVNQISVTPTAAGNGELIALNPISGSEGIDGRDLELVLRNNPGIGGGNPIPNSPALQQVFSNGKLIDSNGNMFHVNAIFNDTVSTQVVIRIDKEPDQPNPQIVNTLPFILLKRDVFVTDDSNGVPQGRQHWAIATLDWNSTDGIDHGSKVVDLRVSVSKQDEAQRLLITRDNLEMVGGGNISFDLAQELLAWTGAFSIVNPHGPLQTIAAGQAPLTDGGSLAYEMDLESGGAIQRGTQAVTVSSGGMTATLAAVDLTDVRLGNILLDSAGDLHVLTAIDNVNDTVTAATSIATGAAVIYKDSFGPGKAPLDKYSFILAVRSGNDVLVGGENNEADTEDRNLKLVRGGTWDWNSGTAELTWSTDAFIQVPGLLENRNQVDADTIILANDGDVAYVEINRTPGAPASLAVSIAAIQDVLPSKDLVIIARRIGADVIVGSHSTRLKSGQSSELDAQMSDQNLAFIGTTTTADGSTDYSSNVYVTDGDSLETAIGDLDAGLNAVETAVTSITWKAPVVNFASLPSMSNNDGDVRLTLDDNVLYRWNSADTVWLETGRWKSPVLNFASLPVSNNLDGDVRIVLDTRLMYSWIDTSSQWIPVSGSGGSVKANFLDPISTVLPTGTSVTIDGISGANDDLVLFTNLSSGNNRVYKLSGVGISLAWNAELVFNGSINPTDGDSVRILEGNAFEEQLAVFDGTNFKVNDVIRYFDGVSGDFWEQSSIKTTTLNDNTTGNIFTISFAGSENMSIKYSILRGSIKETGELYLTTDGVDVAITRTSAYLGDPGIEFNAAINGSDIELNYATTNLGSDATFKYFVSRWSDSSGGPTGIPSYSGGGGGGGSAAGSNTDIQYNNAGTLAADSRFQWDSSVGALDLNDMQFTALSSGITLNDNQISPTNVIAYNASSFRFVIIEYSCVRDGDYRVGRMLISNDGTNIGFSDDFVETSSTGLNFNASILGANVQVEYTSSSTGFTGTFKYTVRRWN